MVDKEVAITYETLYELRRREKGRAELQQLQPTFFNDVMAYLNDKKAIVDSQKGQLFAEEEAEKTASQLANVRRIIKELYDIREKKILAMAINKSRTQSSIVDTSTLLDEERKLYDTLTATLLYYRRDLIVNLLQGKQGTGASEAHGSEQADVVQASVQEEAKPADLARQSNVQLPESVIVRFTQSVSRFIGPSLERYGPFSPEEQAAVPAQIARILITSGKAVPIAASAEVSMSESSSPVEVTMTAPHIEKLNPEEPVLSDEAQETPEMVAGDIDQNHYDDGSEEEAMQLD